MTIGYVLIITSPMHEHKVYNKLIKNKKIKEVHPLFGEYDLIIKIEFDDFQSMGEFIVNEIRQLNGIIATKTLTGAPNFM
ncbi:unnamed protein product [marine sediment metagenome]|uniref:Transcription regulator AsnC/Lrp ligand binding domain-containing protein n=1 Tax=marine sediment metagenome TaxID=412755 RepID=X1MY09_9ZZZZ